MARNTTTASHQLCFADRASMRASAQSWRALVIAVVVLMLIGPALVVGVLLIVEAALSGQHPQSVKRSLPEPERAGWRASAPRLMSFRPHESSPKLLHA